ncbi:MAG: MBL fold metallo-hydrolase, partial [Nannocystaceae bacterium]
MRAEDPQGASAEPQTPRSTPETGPLLRVLGVAQDAGVPQLGCRCTRCSEARADGTEFFAASVGLSDGEGHVYLFDATPDIRAQVPMMRELLDDERRVAARVRRPVDGIFLTHGHMGHYAGLLHLGFEAAHADGVSVYGTTRMIELLRSQAPWSQLIDKGELAPEVLTDASRVSLGEVSVRPVTVPHRAEFTDTVGYVLEGPRRSALYLPDVARWEQVEDVAGLVKDIDLLLVDGTFFSGGELPGRDLAEIGHPLVQDSMARFQDRVAAASLKVVFIHLNHTNPLLDPDSPARKEVESRGFEVAA